MLVLFDSNVRIKQPRTMAMPMIRDDRVFMVAPFESADVFLEKRQYLIEGFRRARVGEPFGPSVEAMAGTRQRQELAGDAMLLELARHVGGLLMGDVGV